MNQPNNFVIITIMKMTKLITKLMSRYYKRLIEDIQLYSRGRKRGTCLGHTEQIDLKRAVTLKFDPTIIVRLIMCKKFQKSKCHRFSLSLHFIMFPNSIIALKPQTLAGTIFNSLSMVSGSQPL